MENDPLHILKGVAQSPALAARDAVNQAWDLLTLVCVWPQDERRAFRLTQNKDA